MSKRFLFFGTGANFTLFVFNRLVELNQPPLAVVIPEYPPARQYSSITLPLSFNQIENSLIKNANALDLPVFYAPEAFEQQLIDQLHTMSFDFLLLACWPYLLGKKLCSLANNAALNIHPSLLPEFRGANPIEQQLQSDDRAFGVSLHLLSEQFDSGDIVNQARFGMGDPLNRNSIEYRAAITGVDLFLKAMDDFGTPAWKPREQD